MGTVFNIFFIFRIYRYIFLKVHLLVNVLAFQDLWVRFLENFPDLWVYF